MKSFISILAWAVLMVCAGGSSFAQSAEHQEPVFTSSQGFSITPPDGWTVASKDGTHQLAAEVQEKVNGIGNVDLDRLAVFMFNPAETDQNLNVAILPHKEVAEESGAQQLADGIRSRIGATPRMSVSRESFGTKSAMVIDFDSNMSGAPDRTWMVILPAGNHALLITCGAPQSSFEQVAPLFKNAIGSITIAESHSSFHLPTWIIVVVIALLARTLFRVMSQKKPCPVCNHTISKVISDQGYMLLFPFTKRKCQQCGSEWIPAYSRLSRAVFVVFALGSAAIVFYLDDSVYIHGRINDVSSDDKPIVFAGVFFSLIAGSLGLINSFLLLPAPKVEISHKGVWTPSPDKLTPETGGAVAQSNLKTNERRDPQNYSI
jgi:hypothetical protein